MLCYMAATRQHPMFLLMMLARFSPTLGLFLAELPGLESTSALNAYWSLEQWQQRVDKRLGQLRRTDRRLLAELDTHEGAAAQLE